MLCVWDCWLRVTEGAALRSHARDPLQGMCDPQVVEARPVHNRGGRSSGSARMSECTVGDESGVVVLTATGDQGAARSQIPPHAPQVTC